MKKILLLICFILCLSSCNIKTEKEQAFYTETKTSFFDLRHENWVENTWIRNPENLKIIHESFKKYGYDKLKKIIFTYNNEFLIRGIYIKRNLNHLLDSLELTYKTPKSQTLYYKKFWARRQAENNAPIVFEIIKEINQQRLANKPIRYNQAFVNDTLVDLLKIEFDTINLSPKKTIHKFNSLKQYGFHQSAYNLLYERTEYQHININRNKLKTSLIEIPNPTTAWLIDNSK